MFPVTAATWMASYFLENTHMIYGIETFTPYMELMEHLFYYGFSVFLAFNKVSSS
jgi:hypothetical protein